MSISIIIPTFNEESGIATLIRYIRVECTGGARAEIIVADGFSTDQTCAKASEAGAHIVQGEKGRANQMNCGAALARGEILFFLHADTFPPASFLTEIERAHSRGYPAGCFRLSFDHDHWFLRFNSFFTRFNFTPFRFGDQGLFIRKDLFSTTGGFDPRLRILEDQQLVRQIVRATRFTILNAAVRTSARKYLQNGIFRLQFIFILLYFLYRCGMNQSTLIRIYKRFIRDQKLDDEQTTCIFPVRSYL